MVFATGANGQHSVCVSLLCYGLTYAAVKVEVEELSQSIVAGFYPNGIVFLVCVTLHS